MVPPPGPPDVQLVRLLSSPRGRRSALLSSLQCLLSLTGSMGIVLLFAGIPQLIYSPEVTASNVVTFLSGALLLTLMVAGNACIGYHYHEEALDVRDPDSPVDDKPPSYDDLFQCSGQPPDYYSVVGSEADKLADIAPVHQPRNSSSLDSVVLLPSALDLASTSRTCSTADAGIAGTDDFSDRIGTFDNSGGVYVEASDASSGTNAAVSSLGCDGSSIKINHSDPSDISDSVSNSSVVIDIDVSPNIFSLKPENPELNVSLKSPTKSSNSDSKSKSKVGKLRTYLKRSRSVNSVNRLSNSHDQYEQVSELPDVSDEDLTVKFNHRKPNRSNSFCEESVNLV